MKMFMKKSFIKLFPVFVFIILGCMIPSSVNAVNRDFAVDSKGVVTKYIGVGGDVVIPPEIDGIKVTSIGIGAFDSCKSLTSVSIPNGVTSISHVAFQNCSSLTNITFPDGIKSIGEASFAECNSLTNIIIPNSVTTVYGSAFRDCDKLGAVYVYNDTIDLLDIYGTLGNKDITTLYAHKGSTTEAYANKYGYKFVELTDTKPLISISLNKLTINMDIGKSSLLSVIYNPSDTTDDKTVTWTSSNPAVAHVYSNGKVKGISSGTAVITATVGGKTASCIVTVR